jgi:hypothetical protein
MPTANTPSVRAGPAITSTSRAHLWFEPLEQRTVPFIRAELNEPSTSRESPVFEPR